ncbi:MAG: 30S ribosome-binding factor RbfA [Gammaproteobacteria bacterium]|nr:30S ribosome-binding factor RbfA [Gammaproteobacteria bacterium]
MAKEFSRTLRIAEHIKRQLAGLIRDEIKDPRVGRVTVSDVEVSRDLAHAKVYVTVLGLEAEAAQSTIEALNHAAGFLRRELGQQLNTRTVPALRFFYDAVQEEGNRIEALIDKAMASHRDGTAGGQ